MLIPLALLAVVTLLIRALDLDMRIERFFVVNDHWYLKENRFVQAVYLYGPWPAVLAGIVAAVLIGASRFIRWLQPARALSTFVLLALLLGPGLVVNFVLKAHFGRPRPREVAEFGGSKAFLPVGSPQFGEPGRSFPSGHAAAGFFWIVGAIHFWATRPRLAALFGVAACLHGGLLGFARMAQGAHWPSDILWSAGVVYLICWALHWLQTAALEAWAT